MTLAAIARRASYVWLAPLSSAPAPVGAPPP